MVFQKMAFRLTTILNKYDMLANWKQANQIGTQSDNIHSKRLMCMFNALASSSNKIQAHQRRAIIRGYY